MTNRSLNTVIFHYILPLFVSYPAFFLTSGLVDQGQPYAHQQTLAMNPQNCQPLAKLPMGSPSGVTLAASCDLLTQTSAPGVLISDILKIFQLLFLEPCISSAFYKVQHPVIHFYAIILLLVLLL